MQSLSQTPEPNLIYVEKMSFENRVSLRRLTVEDLNHFYVWASDLEVARSMTWEAYTHLEEAEKFLNHIVAHHPWFKAICLDGVPIGSITLTQGKGAHACRAEIGFVIAKQYWGKGIATLALKEAINLGFDDLKIKRIEAFVDPDNIASQKVLLKAGMQLDGLLKNYTLFKEKIRDRYLFSITKS